MNDIHVFANLSPAPQALSIQIQGKWVTNSQVNNAFIQRQVWILSYETSGSGVVGGVADLDAQREVLQLGLSSREMLLLPFGAAAVC